MSRRDSGRKFFFVSRYNINPFLIDISSLRMCLRPVDMTLAQNCTGVKPDSSENESNAFRINLAASSNVTPRSLSRVVANFV